MLVDIETPTLTAGNYILSFAFKEYDIFASWWFVEDRTCFTNNIDVHAIHGGENWNIFEFPFTVLEGQTFKHLIFCTIHSWLLNLDYVFSGIDNIVIKKEFIPYNITTLTNGHHGTVEASQNFECEGCTTENGYLAAAGEVVTFNAVPYEGYSLNCYGVYKKSGGSITVTGNQFIMPEEEVFIAANFTTVEPGYHINVINGTSDKDEAIAGETVNITANTAPLWQEFDRWVTNDVVTFADVNSSVTSFVMPANDVTVTATYKALTPHSITVIDGFSDKDEEIAGKTVTITANPAPQFQEFDKWISDDNVTFANANDTITSFVMIGQAVVVTATYKALPKYHIWVTEGTTDKSLAFVGETVTITARDPYDNKEFYQWLHSYPELILENRYSPTTSFNMIEQDVLIEAVFLHKSIIAIIVREDDNVTPIVGATVTVTNDDGKKVAYTEVTDEAGTAIFRLPDGSYSYTVEKDGYIITTGTFEVEGEDDIIETNLSVRRVSQLTSFELYPVPASDIVKVVRTSAGKALIEIYSSNGELLQSLETTKIETSVDVSLLTAGVYIIKVTDDKGVSTRRLVIN